MEMTIEQTSKMRGGGRGLLAALTWKAKNDLCHLPACHKKLALFHEPTTCMKKNQKHKTKQKLQQLYEQIIFTHKIPWQILKRIQNIFIIFIEARQL